MRAPSLPPPPQLGGLVLHEGLIAEMKTGEGKTLVATLPAYVNALTGGLPGGPGGGRAGGGACGPHGPPYLATGRGFPAPVGMMMYLSSA